MLFFWCDPHFRMKPRGHRIGEREAMVRALLPARRRIVQVGDRVPVITRTAAGLEGRLALWGLGEAPPGQDAATIAASSMSTDPRTREAWNCRHTSYRFLVPATGWAGIRKGRSRVYLATEDQPITFGGILRDVRIGRQEFSSLMIGLVPGDASTDGLVDDIPLIVLQERYQDWLTPEPVSARKLTMGRRWALIHVPATPELDAVPIRGRIYPLTGVRADFP